MVVHLFLNNNKALDFLPINSIKNGGITNQWEAGGVKWSPYARAAWVHEFKDGRFQRVDTVAQIDQGSRSVWLGDTDKSFARITLGLQAQITPRLGAYAELNTRLAHKEGKQPSGSLGVQYRF